MARTKRVTLQEISELVGVSKFSVSRALAGKPGISAASREKILAAAERLGYPGRLAERSRPVRNSVLLMLPRRMMPDQEFWPHLMLGVQDAARTRGANLVMEVVSPAEEAGLLPPPTLARLPVDGVICTGLSAAYVRMLQQSGHCVVTFDWYSPELRVDGVMADNRSGTRSAVAYLTGLGHTRIGFIGNNRWSDSFCHRFIGYRQALEERGLPVRPEWCLLRTEQAGGPWETAYLRAQLVQLTEMPSAWVCVNDKTALNLLPVLGALGLRVPDDVSVVGFDDLERAAQAVPPLTTVRCYKELMGARCAERLYRRLAAPHEPADLLLVGTQLCIRESVKRQIAEGKMRPGAKSPGNGIGSED